MSSPRKTFNDKTSVSPNDAKATNTFGTFANKPQKEKMFIDTKNAIHTGFIKGPGSCQQ